MLRLSNYQKSNLILSIDFPVSKNAKIWFIKTMRHKSEEKRQKFGTELLDELGDQAGIDIVNLKVSSANQYHKKYKGRVVSKQYGYYRPKSSYIYIHNRTAVRGQILAPKTFVDTLLHEWMHHYDFKRLRLNSIHSAGFYARLKDLKEKLGYFQH